MIVRFLYCHKQPAAYDVNFFCDNWLVFRVVYVIYPLSFLQVPELGVFVMGFGRYYRFLWVGLKDFLENGVGDYKKPVTAQPYTATFS